MTVAMWTTRMTTFMTDQLRECPFCGSSNVVVRGMDKVYSDRGWVRYKCGGWFVMCDGCKFSHGSRFVFDAEGSIPCHAHNSADEAIAAWNTRPTAVASHAEGEVALSYIIGQMRIQADHDFKNGLESASTRVGHWADELDRIRTLDPRWHIAGQVREKLDQACCPDHWMRVAVETITAMTIHCPPRSGDEARDAALRRLVSWNRNVNGTGEELGQICIDADAAMASRGGE